ncbi:hypothetical protein CEP52_006666 [Fusarium oligoseptatum]|uniref:Uncharacterized protein n=1 Tax=Fusarium oligoseptatum TaxID=2604345 RepID=A0A428TRF7_9HYPO|nr:hypothetical protein CEP52_006666 [Fusarium oligoseptatum]
MHSKGVTAQGLKDNEQGYGGTRPRDEGNQKSGAGEDEEGRPITGRTGNPAAAENSSPGHALMHVSRRETFPFLPLPSWSPPIGSFPAFTTFDRLGRGRWHRLSITLRWKDD